MDARSFSTLAVLSCVTLLFTTGCPRPAPPENAVTWGIKAATGRLTETTPREWQALAQKVDELTPEVDIPDLTDEQAQAIVDFIQANELNSVQAITSLIEQAQADPSVLEEIEIPDSVMDLFGSTEIDFEGAVNDILNET
ncbi:MAG: hypothetical protein ACE5I3_04665 [Phycisphaerae bacterium]